MKVQWLPLAYKQCSSNSVLIWPSHMVPRVARSNFLVQNED